jgi:hypothetical protein
MLIELSLTDASFEARTGAGRTNASPWLERATRRAAGARWEEEASESPPPSPNWRTGEGRCLSSDRLLVPCVRPEVTFAWGRRALQLAGRARHPRAAWFTGKDRSGSSALSSLSAAPSVAGNSPAPGSPEHAMLPETTHAVAQIPRPSFMILFTRGALSVTGSPRVTPLREDPSSTQCATQRAVRGRFAGRARRKPKTRGRDARSPSMLAARVSFRSRAVHNLPGPPAQPEQSGCTSWALSPERAKKVLTQRLHP